MRRYSFGILVFFAVVAISFWAFRYRVLNNESIQDAHPDLPVAQSFASTSEQADDRVGVASSTPDVVTPPSAPKPIEQEARGGATSSSDERSVSKSLNLAVPFLSQAPTQNWDMPYQEACEEASMIMVDAFLSGRSQPFSPQEGDGAIVDLVREEERVGILPDMTVDQAVNLVPGYFSDRTAIRIESSEKTIKQWLNRGYPVIVPAYGKALRNPNFRNGGPMYHMLVIKGYLADGRWITNDPGTRKGADYIYDHDLLLDAIHDWNGGDVPNGQSVAFVMQVQSR